MCCLLHIYLKCVMNMLRVERKSRERKKNEKKYWDAFKNRK